VKRVLAIAGLVLAVGAVLAGAVALAWRLDNDRQYRRLLVTGDQALSAGDAFGAIEAFSGALALRPDSMVAYYRRAEAYRAQNRTDEALANLREANRLAPDAPEPLVALAELFELQLDYGQAAVWYGMAADRLGDTDPVLLYRLALARYQAGTPALAREPLERIAERSDAFGEAHYLLGLVLRDTNEPAEAAIAALEQALRLSPALAAAREELADLYREAGRPVDELRQLQALADADAQPSRQLAIAMAQARAGQYDGALGTLGPVVSQSSADSRADIALARVLLARAERVPDRGAVARALAVLERALGGTARRGEGTALYGRALYLSGDYVHAERILREAVATSPAELEAFRFLADAAERLSHDLVARDALVSLDLLEGDTASAVARASRARRIGELSLRAGDAATALRSFTRALDLAPADPALLGQLARARWATGDRAGAREALDRALALAPRDAELLRLSRTIR
jgi:tetratricopeptide (TPR) repeat protein